MDKMNQIESGGLPIQKDTRRFNRTVWIRFLRTLTWIGFWLITAAGALILLASVVAVFAAGTPVPLLLGLLWAGISVLMAFLLCSKTFIKLDMAEDLHKIREIMETK